MRLKVKIFLDDRKRRAQQASQQRTNLEQAESQGEEDSIEVSEPEELDEEGAQASSARLVEPTREKRAADPKKAGSPKKSEKGSNASTSASSEEKRK